MVVLQLQYRQGEPLQLTAACPPPFLGYRGDVHPPSDDEGPERTWFEHKQRPRKSVPKGSVHGKQSQRTKRCGAKTTSQDGKAGHVMTHVCHRAR